MPRKNGCDNVVTISQHTGTCWFNALLMILFYSDHMRKHMILRSKLWKSKDPRINEIYRIFKTILKNQYVYSKKTKSLKFDYFNLIKPEHILETLNSTYEDFNFNPRQKIGYRANYYLDLLLKFLHIDPVNVIFMKRKQNNPQKVIKTSLNGIYHLDSQYAANFNSDICKSSHAIAGITCKGQRYVYNGWTRFTYDNIENRTNASALPCELMKFDWTDSDKDLVINLEECKLDHVPLTNKSYLKSNMIFNFSSDFDNHILYVSEKYIEGTAIPIKEEKIKKQLNYDPNCIREISNNDEKIKELFNNIIKVDKDNKYKHVIYTDFKKSAKAIKEYMESHLGYKNLLENGKFRSKADFAYLVGGVVDNGKPLTVAQKKKILSIYNNRPSNIYGENCRFIIINNAFKEGIDLFDVKHVHILEPPKNASDLKQVIGRATRTCGQQGLEFETNKGWILDIHIYDVKIPSIVQQRKALDSKTNTLSKLASLYTDNEDLRRIDILNDMMMKNNLDYEFTKALHFENRNITRKVLKKQEFLWNLPNPPVDLCNNRPATIELTPTQKFVKHVLNPDSKINGLLAVHSVGTGKTITAISTALESFKDYTILWVTRSSLKTDMQKDLIKFDIQNGKIGYFPPLSYKQFANLLTGQNDYFKKLVKLNGDKDPLRRVFIIIDEAHKLVDQDDLKFNEKVDIDVLNKRIQNSYILSGKDSCKLLIMTATPIPNSPKDLFSLMNLLKNSSDQILDIEKQNKMIDKKDPKLKQWIKSNVSYLNRSKDATQFAQPKINFHFTNMTVRSSIFDTKEDIKEMRKNKMKSKDIREDVRKFSSDKSQEKMLTTKCLKA